MKTTGSYRLTVAGLLICLGVLIPFVTGHAFGMRGTVLLPMHFPVLVSGFVLGPLWGAAVGVLTPVLSSILTGMPPLYPTLPMMVAELGAYGFLTGYFYRARRFGIFASLIPAMIAGRIVHAVLFALILLARGTPVTITALAFVAEGIPGTALQLILIPLVLRALLKNQRAERRELSADEREVTALIEALKREILDGKRSLALISGGQVIYSDSGNGVSPLLKLVEEHRALLKDAVVVDKIIGKAAAMLLTLGGAREVHALVASEAGQEYLKRRKIPLHADRSIELIENRTRTGICPFEKAVLELEDPEEGRRMLAETMQRLRKGA